MNVARQSDKAPFWLKFLAAVPALFYAVRALLRSSSQ